MFLTFYNFFGCKKGSLWQGSVITPWPNWKQALKAGPSLFQGKQPAYGTSTGLSKEVSLKKQVSTCSHL